MRAARMQQSSPLSLHQRTTFWLKWYSD